MPSETLPLIALAGVSALLLMWAGFRLKARWAGRGRAAAATGTARDFGDTLAAWPPEAARVMTSAERQAYDLLKRALPGMLVLTQVPLSRFVRVPTRHSYAVWLQRVGMLSADLVLCDKTSRVLAVIDVRSPIDSPKSLQRHERMARTLKAAGIGVHVWREGMLPDISVVRATLASEFERAAGAAERSAGAKAPLNSGAMPLIPVPEISEVLADGDQQFSHGDAAEPVPSAFFDDMVNEPLAVAVKR
jgi:hypothetical protein